MLKEGKMSRIYGDCAFIWEILTADDVYLDEAQLIGLFSMMDGPSPFNRLWNSVLVVDFLLSTSFTQKLLILVDQSESMLSLSRQRNPEPFIYVKTCVMWTLVKRWIWY